MSFKNTRNYKKSLIPDHCEIQNCNFTLSVTRHRIKAGRNGGKYISGNVIGLCPNHHSSAELGLLSQYELFQIVYARLSSQNTNRVG